MGGIIGKLSFDRNVEISRATVLRMIDAVSHRGAAASGSYIGSGIALSWCDTRSSPSSQVSRNEAATVRAVADSELSNAASLQRLLERLGHAFEDDSDAEIMAHAYEEWGDACVEKFSGPFACAIWDEAERRLLLARDHVGLRPLSFALLHGDGVVFGSEIRALLQDPSVGRECSPEAIDTYLALGYVPSPLTMYRRISKLEPAHTLIVEGRRLTTRQYWDFPFDAPRMRSRREALDLLQTCLRTSVAAQVDATDAGALASGGIASTAIAATLPRGRAAVSVGLEQDIPNLVRVAETAEHLGLRSAIDLAAPEAGDVARLLAWRFDEPVADPDVVSLYSVLLAARRYMDVALTGHGAAILWAGYARHRIERIEWDMRSVLGGPLARLGGHVGRALSGSMRGARTLAHLTLPPAGACATKHAHGHFDDECRHSVYTRGFSWRVRHADPFARHVELYAQCAAADPLTRALYVDARTCLPGSHLPVADRIAAAVGLRLRHPFLDRELVDMAFALQSRWKLRGPGGMYPLRQLAARRLPPALLPPAKGTAPGRPWLSNALATLVPTVLLHEHFDNRGIFSRPALRALWDEHRSGRRDHAQRLWSVLMLEFWFREFVDGDAAAQPAEYAVLLRAA